MLPSPKEYQRCLATIILVDDEPDLLNIMRESLEKKGYSVLCTQSAGEAIRQIQATRDIDVLVSDVRMPEMSGPELAAALRQIKHDLRVVFISGFTENKLSSGECQFDAFLQKPFSLQDLRTCIEHLIADRPTPPRHPYNLSRA